MDPVSFQVAVQVRLGSQRLPRKALLPLGSRESWPGRGECVNLEGPRVLDWVLWNLRRSHRVQRFLLLCPESDTGELRPYAEHHGFELFSGPEHDVLERFCRALKCYPAEYCFRATADNPLAPGSLLDFMLERLRDSDYYWIRGLPYGCAFELFRSSVLCDLGDLGHLKELPTALSSGDREHVTRYLYRHPEQYRLQFEEISELLGPEYIGLQDLRLSLDTEQDRQFLEDLLWRFPFEEELPRSLLALKDLTK